MDLHDGVLFYKFHAMVQYGCIRLCQAEVIMYKGKRGFIRAAVSVAVVCGVMSSISGVAAAEEGAVVYERRSREQVRETRTEGAYREEARTIDRERVRPERVRSAVGRADERARKAYLLTDLVIPMFPGLGSYRPAPGTIVDADTAKPVNVKNYDAGVLARVKTDGKWGLIGTDGKILIEPTYKRLEEVGDGTFINRDDKKNPVHIDKYGMPITQNRELTETVSPSRREVSEPVTFALQSEDGGIDESYRAGDMSTEVSSDVGRSVPLTYVSDTWRNFKEKGKYGFVDSSGRAVLSPVYKEVLAPFSEGIAFVKNDKGKKVAIDESGKELFAVPFDEIDPYRGGLAEYRRSVSGFGLGGLVGLVTGGLISHGSSLVFSGMTYDGVKRGYIDRQGNIVIDSKSDAVYPMTRYGTVVKNKGKVGFVKRDGSYLIEPGEYEVGDMDIGAAVLSLENKSTDKVGMFSMIDGSKIIDFLYDEIDFLGGSRFLAKKSDKKYLVDIESGEVLLAMPSADTIDGFAGDEFAWLHRDDSSYRIIDRNGVLYFTAPEGLIDAARGFVFGYSAVKSGGKWGIMDYDGSWLVNPIYDDIDLLD